MLFRLHSVLLACLLLLRRQQVDFIGDHGVKQMPLVPNTHALSTEPLGAIQSPVAYERIHSLILALPNLLGVKSNLLFLKKVGRELLYYNNVFAILRLFWVSSCLWPSWDVGH